MGVNGNTIKQLRKTAGLTQGALGEKLGVVKQTISNWENNISEPNSETLSALSILFNVSVAHFYSESNTNYKKETPKFVIDLKKNICDLIKEQDIPKDEFAKKTGFNIDGNKIPSIENLIKIANELNVSTDFLLDKSKRKRITTEEEMLLQTFNRCDDECKKYLIAKAGVLCIEGISAVSSSEHEKYADKEKKSFSSNGIEEKRA